MNGLETYIMKQGAVVEHLAAAAEQIPPDKATWRPYPKALPWMALIDHTSIGRRIMVLKTLKGEPFDFPGCFFDPANHSKSPQEAAQAQRESWAALKSFLESQPADFAAREVMFTKGRKMKAEQLLWFAYEENVHHRGQAWIYARMNGLTPPAIWGTERPD
ncbi:MAG: DinB family protein [Nitrospinae bacterium]|nr:DinB family protein [Nitrospinota bacterium]